MALGSVMQTALTGLSMAGQTVAVVANNLANARTPGFKASQTQTATQTPRTLGLGAAPTSSQGGTNPTQFGNGALAVQATTDTTPGPMLANGVEQSNTDVGESLIDLAVASDSFTANLAVIGVANEMLDELIHLGRA